MNWESLIAARSRPTETLRIDDPVKRRKANYDRAYKKTDKYRNGRKKYDRAYRQAHREERNEYNRKWRAQHPDYMKNYHNTRKAA